MKISKPGIFPRPKPAKTKRYLPASHCPACKHHNFNFSLTSQQWQCLDCGLLILYDIWAKDKDIAVKVTISLRQKNGRAALNQFDFVIPKLYGRSPAETAKSVRHVIDDMVYQYAHEV